MIKSLSDKIKLLNGIHMPAVGLGVYKAEAGNGEAYGAVRDALEIGYRHIDTASMYHNEKEVGRALRDSGVPREEVFVTTKMWPMDYADPLSAFEASVRELELDYVDAYLLHWPGTDPAMRYRAWEALMDLEAQRKIRCAGVSNFLPDQLDNLTGRFGNAPAVNQIELHPWRQQKETVRYCKDKGIQVVSWGPIFHRHLSEEPLMEEIGAHYGATPAQATLRWHLQKGFAVIPKSVRKSRIFENAQLFGFEITDDDMRRIDALDGKRRFGWDEEKFDGNI